MRRANQNGITLIALVITIVVLLILAVVSISTLTGDNGLLSRARQAEFSTEYKEIEENVKLYNLNSQIINNVQKQESVEVFPLGEMISESEKESWKEDKVELINQIEEKTEKVIDDTSLYWIDFDKLDVRCDHKYIIDASTGLLFCYEGHRYLDKMYHIPDDIEKNSQITIKPKFEEISEYPLLKESGIEPPGTVRIKYSNEPYYKNLYSLDQGKTWNEYVGEFAVLQDTVVYAKSINTITGVETISNKEVIINPKGIASTAYDGLLNTYDNSGKIDQGYKYMAVDESAIGMTVEANLGWYYAQILLLDENEDILYRSDIPGVSSGKKTVNFEIVEGTKYLVLYCSNEGGDGALLYEIQLKNTPQINIVQKAYPQLTNEGINKPNMKVTLALTGNESMIEKTLYSKDNQSWEEYKGGEIQLEVGETIYAKNVLKNGGESKVVTQQCQIDSRAITEKAYDGSLGTYDNSGKISEGYKYMVVDESAIGVTVEANLGWYYAQILLLDENEDVLYRSDIPGVSSGKKTVNFEIVEGTKYLVLYCSNEGGDGALLYEIQIKK